jgi:hypothetical protein
MSSAQIASDMRELKNINKEIKRNGMILKQLRDRKKNIETNILKYLRQNEQSGVKYEDIVAVQKERKTRERKTQEEKKEDIVKLLENNGIRNADNLYKELLETMKGKEELVPVLKVKEHRE